MSKKFNIREWVLSVKYWSLLFIPHVSICLIFLIYTLVGASIIQEIESDDLRTTSSPKLETTTTTTTDPIVPPKTLDRERERLLSKIIDKRQTFDLQQYTKYINKHIREYEDELKKSYKSTTPSSVIIEKSSINEENSRWTFSGSLFFIGTTLTTIGSNDFIPVTNIGKLFLMIYAAIGIPLTLVFLSDLSLLITRLIKYLSLLLLRIYSTKYFLHIRQWLLFRFIEKQLNISIPISTDEDDLFSSKLHQPLSLSFDHENDTQINHSMAKKEKRLSQHIHIKHIRKIYNILIDTLKNINDDTDLTILQLIITLFIYILIGACLIKSDSYFESIYICFTSIFTINLSNFYRKTPTTTSQENNMKSMFSLAIYLLFGLAIVSLCIKVVQIRIQIILEDIGKKLLRDLVEFLRQMGFHELSTDDILATTDLNSYSILGSTSDNILFRQQRLSRTLSTTSELPSTTIPRPVGIAEPVRRLSAGLIIRAYKKSEGDTNTDKSVQVNTIIRSCGRCAGSSLSPTTSVLSVRKHSTMSNSPSSTGETSSGCEEDDVVTATLPPPNLDRLRQRRATLVAKTIINQMATQPPALCIDEPVPALTLLTAQRQRSNDSQSPVPLKYSTKKATSPTTTITT